MKFFPSLCCKRTIFTGACILFHLIHKGSQRVADGIWLISLWNHGQPLRSKSAVTYVSGMDLEGLVGRPDSNREPMDCEA
jgi:hypothetical protein